ncbi:MAG: pyridoxamine 5'-phosphate oxidase family protein [Promethearchaeota archaeon]
MTKKSFSFEFIEKNMRKKTFGILSTVDSDGKSQSTGILYAVSPPSSKFSLYVLTDKRYKKVQNILKNASVSFVIPFPHYVLRFVPASCVQFQGNAKILPINNKDAQEAFTNSHKMLKMNLDQVNKLEMDKEETVFIKIVPSSKISCYGLGISMMQLRKNIEIGSYAVNVPQERL